jgi:hypothetical protein
MAPPSPPPFTPKGFVGATALHPALALFGHPLAREARRIACVGDGRFGPTKGRQRGVRDSKMSLPD